MKLEQHSGVWHATYHGMEFVTGERDIMDAINRAVAYFEFAKKEA